ncbi:MAG: NAD(P)-dependent alcohol dehydrogenase [Chloroflexi bacterium]|nr:NAD(P)-dependent alcohol dehydrogenase [Chloroflexota bacterium]
MKAVINTKHGLQLQHVEKGIPGTDEILIRVHAATVTAGDVILSNLPGLMYWAPVRSLLGVPPKKTIPGHEFAGIVEAAGQHVTRFKVGDPVFGTTTGLAVGANADYVRLPEAWSTGVIALKPGSLSYTQTAALPVGAMTALYLLRKAEIQPGEKVLIYGASGSVGTYAVQLARYLGADVTGVCSTRNVEMVRSLGANRVIDYTQEDLTQSDEAYAVVFDAVGKMLPAQRKRVLRPNGRHTTIRSATHEDSGSLEFLRTLVDAGEIKPIIDRCFHLEQIAEAYEYVRSGRKAGNVVIQIAEDAS